MVELEGSDLGLVSSIRSLVGIVGRDAAEHPVAGRAAPVAAGRVRAVERSVRPNERSFDAVPGLECPGVECPLWRAVVNQKIFAAIQRAGRQSQQRRSDEDWVSSIRFSSSLLP